MRRGQLTEKDMQVLREGDKTKVQRDKRHLALKDYSLQHTVRIEWDLNPEAIRERMFKLVVDDQEMILDAEEVMRAIRWV